MLLAPAIDVRFSRAEIPPDAVSTVDPLAVVRAVLAVPDNQLDYARAKLAFDRIIDPAFDQSIVMGQLDRLAERAEDMAKGDPSPSAKLAALRKLIYQCGSWNDYRPFDYDHADFKDIRASLLSNYLTTRRGNCVSMPVLFLVLASKLGLEIALARATSHLFVRHHVGEQITNLETTSGALPARDTWICQTRRVSQRGIDSGLYMRSLSRREAVGTMALVVVEYLMAHRRYRDAIAVTELLSRNDGTDGISLAHQGNAYCEILKGEFLDKYGSAMRIPLRFREEYCLLMQCNHAAFDAAKALGWEPIDRTA